MIPPQNLLPVGGVVTCAVASPQKQRSTRPCGGDPQVHCMCLRARTNPCTEPRFQEPVRSCFLLAFYAKLSQSSTRVWMVILTSLSLLVRTEQNAGGSKDKKATAVTLIYFQKNKMKTQTLESTPPTPVRVVLYTWTLQFNTDTSRLFSIVSLSTTSLHGLMLARDSKSQCTSDSTLTVT